MEALPKFESPPVIISLGSCLTKVGVAGEHMPRCIMPTLSLHQTEHATLETDWLDILSQLLRQIFIEKLMIDPAERKIIICESIFATIPFKGALARVLFHNLEAPKICFVSEMISPLYICGLNTGLVVDIGYRTTRIVPVVYGSLLYYNLKVLEVGGKDVDENMKRLLLIAQSNEADLRLVENLTDEQLVDIKVRACFVSTKKTSNETGVKEDECAELDSYLLENRKSIKVTRGARAGAAEVLFGDGEINKDPECSLQAGITRCLEDCNVDLRNLLLQNIVLCGGTAELQGLLPRLAWEIRNACLSSKGLKNLNINNAAFANPCIPPLCLQWAGASIYGMLYGIEELTRKKFLETAVIPDWSKIIM